jgi:hypothetical protein
VARDAEYIGSYVNQVDGYPLPNGQTALQLAMQCIQGNGKSAPQSAHARLSLVDRHADSNGEISVGCRRVRGVS